MDRNFGGANNLCLDKLFGQIHETNIIIYGAGYVGRMFYEWCMDHGVHVLLFVCSAQCEADRIEGIQACCIEDLSEEYKKNSIIVIAVKDNLSGEMRATAERLGFTRILELAPLYLPELEFRFNKKKLYRNQMMTPCRGDIQLQGKRLLVIAPHPDDEAIGCGGLLAKYGKNTDVLCVNSSGVKYAGDIDCAETIADNRIREFYNVMDMAGVHFSWIAKIWGVPPMFDGIMNNLYNYVSKFDYAQYDYIFIPDFNDGHREHRYISRELVPTMLENVELKKTVRIGLYEVWAAINDPNYYLDISDVINEKEKFINGYISRGSADYAKRILGLNCYRGLLAGCEYAEAYKIISLCEYVEYKYNRIWSA